MLNRVLYRLAFVFAVISGVAVFAMMCLIAVDVTFRFFRSGIPGTIEIVSVYLMLMTGFLPMALVERQDSMIKVDALFTILRGGRRPVYLFATLVSFLVYAALTYATGMEAWEKVEAGAYVITTRYFMPSWPAYLMVPLALGLTTIISGVRLYEIVTGRVTQPPAEAAMDGMDAPNAGAGATA